jgi:hypothetical protein
LIFSGATFMLKSDEDVIQTLLHPMASVLHERGQLSLELVAVRHQVEVLKCTATRPDSPRLIGVADWFCQAARADGRRPWISYRST